jgi:cytochrome c-type biogenesis protein CcmH/NrfF
MLWLIPITIVIVGAVAFIRARRHGGLTNEPISGQWLAEKRGHEEQNW